MLSLAVFYAAEDAPFLAFVQVIVYTGAVMMLFLFVLMLIGVDTRDSLVETLRGQRLAAGVAGLGFLLLLFAGIRQAVDHQQCWACRWPTTHLMPRATQSLGKATSSRSPACSSLVTSSLSR